MPADWKKHFIGDLVDICTFQWNAIHESILQYFSGTNFSQRVFRIHLEELAANPQSELQGLRSFLDVESPLLPGSEVALPAINVSPERHPLDAASIRRIWNQTKPIYGNLKQ